MIDDDVDRPRRSLPSHHHHHRPSVTPDDNAVTDDPGGGSADIWSGSNGRKVDTAVLATSSSMAGTPRFRGGSRGGGGLGGVSERLLQNHRQNRQQSQADRIFGSQEEYGAIHLGRLQASAIRCDRVDRVSLVLFPLMFFVVNVMYWSYYLLFHDIIAELW